MANFLKKNKGFTLVELLIVIAIIGILVTIVVVAINPIKLISDARDSKHRTNLNQIKAAMQLYYNDCKVYPTDAQVVFGSALGGAGNGVDGTASTCDDNQTYMKQVPNDSTGSYDYRVDGTRQNYEIGADLTTVSTEDTNTQTKCASTISSAYPANTDFVVCND